MLNKSLFSLLILVGLSVCLPVQAAKVVDQPVVVGLEKAQRENDETRQINAYTLYSQRSDYIGGGQYLEFGHDSENYSGFNRNSGGWKNYINFLINDNSYYLDFHAPDHVRVEPGHYAGATRAGVQNNARPGLDAGGSGRGCNTLTGQFDVLEAVYDDKGKLKRFAANYEQHCEGWDAALLGAIRYHSTVPVISKPAVFSSSLIMVIPLVALGNEMGPGQFKTATLRVIDSSEDNLIFEVESITPAPSYEGVEIPAAYDLKSHELKLPSVLTINGRGEVSEYEVVLKGPSFEVGQQLELEKGSFLRVLP